METTVAICKTSLVRYGKVHSANGTKCRFTGSQEESRRAINIMSSRSHQKSPPSVPSEPEFTFHLVEKQTAASPAGIVAGAIVAGPVAALFEDALGTAFDGENEMSSAQTDSQKSASKKSAKPKAKR